ncbi:Na(+)/drug antiporter [uncultured Ruminococcus sp.]|nr:Na(+)/drug antiporter [uncultured Clostridium sp.]SCH65352.1 Na(+)/drug antiporter [uncultured Ruminococcus sp.]
MIKSGIQHFFSCSGVVKPNEQDGTIPPARELYQDAFHIAWPSVLESVLVTMISFVDTMMVGVLGPEAISAVGITTQPRLIMLAVILSFNVGVTAVVSRRKGAEDYEGANHCLKQCVLLSTIMSLVLSVLGIVFARPLLLFAGAGNDIIADSVDYFRIIMIGLFFNGIGLTINGAQRGVGNTKISMQTNLSANVVNVIFNYFLINGAWIFPRLEVRGAAIATTLGNLVALLLAAVSITHRDGILNILHSSASWLPDKRTMKSVWNVGLSALVEQVCMRVGFFLYAKIVSSLGTTAFATHQICLNVLNISFGFGDGLQIASTSLVGQRLGAKRKDLAKLAVAVNQRIGLVISTILVIIFVLGRHVILRLFTTDPQIIEQGGVLMIIMAFTIHAQICQVITSGSLRGAGDTKYTALVSLISIGVLRPLIAYLLCYPLGLGLDGAWYALVIDQFTRLILVMIRFRRGKWTALVL